MAVRAVPNETVRLQDGQIGLVVDTSSEEVRVYVLEGKFKGYTILIAPSTIAAKVQKGWVDITAAT